MKDAAVHDLGYKPYKGTRRKQSVRYRVMIWNLLIMSWRGWWRMKTWVISASMLVAGFGLAIYAFTFMTKNRIVSGMLSGGGNMVMTDLLMIESIRFNTFFVFILGMTVAAGVVADDLKGGAFEFYFSKPIRPRDYVVGKFLGAALVLGTVGVGVPVLLAAWRIGLSGGDGEVTRALALLPKALAIGAYTTVVFTIIPLAFSALGRQRRYTIAAWVVFYVVLSNIALQAGRRLDMLELGALSPFGQVMSFTYEMLDVEALTRWRRVPPVGLSVLASCAYTALGLGIVYWRVRRAETRGLGGG